jgi:hypothetical protein
LFLNSGNIFWHIDSQTPRLALVHQDLPAQFQKAQDFDILGRLQMTLSLKVIERQQVRLAEPVDTNLFFELTRMLVGCLAARDR